MLCDIQGINGVIQSIPRRSFVLLIRVTAFLEVFKCYLSILIGAALADYLSGRIEQAESGAGKRRFCLAVLLDDNELCAEAAVRHDDLYRLTAGYQRDRITGVVQDVSVEGIYLFVVIVPKRHICEVYIPVLVCCPVSDSLSCGVVQGKGYARHGSASVGVYLADSETGALRQLRFRRYNFNTSCSSIFLNAVGVCQNTLLAPVIRVIEDE